MCLSFINEIRLSFLAIGYNAKINKLIKKHDLPKRISLGDTEYHDKAKFLPIYKELLDYARKIAMPTAIEYPSDPPAPYESYKKITRDVREYAQFRMSHFISFIALIIGFISLIVASASFFHSFKC